MSQRFEPKTETLRAALERGLGAESGVEDVRSQLSLAADAPDRELARSLVQILSACGVAEAGREQADIDVEVDAEPAQRSADGSLLGRLESGGTDGIGIEQLDVESLLGVLRGGSLRQRRAALRVLVERAPDLGRKLRQLAETLDGLRDVELEPMLVQVRTELPGALGRKARSALSTWRNSLSDLEERIVAFWEGEHQVEPIMDLPGDERAQLLLRTQLLPDRVLRHLAAVIEGEDGVSERSARLALVESVRYAGDPRLVPSLIVLVESGRSEVVVEAARALRRIDDPRVRPALARVYERTVTDAARAMLAGALGAHGDRRGADYVRQLLDRDERDVRMAALEALDTLGGPEDAEAVAGLLSQPALRLAAVHTLARIGDARSLDALADAQTDNPSSALRAAIEEAREAILARMDLRGEDATRAREATSRLSLVEQRPPKTPAGARFRAWRLLLFGQLLLAFGAMGAGIRRLERAAALRADWAPPWVAIAMAHARKSRYAQALAAFRRAIESDPRVVERNPLVVRSLARTFLRRAEQVERDGRRDVARGLLGEVLDLDLRRAPSSVRFELQRRRRALQRAADRAA